MALPWARVKALGRARNERPAPGDARQTRATFCLAQGAGGGPGVRHRPDDGITRAGIDGSLACSEPALASSIGRWICRRVGIPTCGSRPVTGNTCLQDCPSIQVEWKPARGRAAPARVLGTCRAGRRSQLSGASRGAGTAARIASVGPQATRFGSLAARPCSQGSRAPTSRATISVMRTVFQRRTAFESKGGTVVTETILWDVAEEHLDDAAFQWARARRRDLPVLTPAHATPGCPGEARQSEHRGDRGGAARLDAEHAVRLGRRSVQR